MPSSAPPYSRETRILFVGEAVTLAHVGRPIALAQALNASGQYDIRFACAPRYRALTNSQSFGWHSLESIAPERFLEALAKGNPLYDASTLSGYVTEDLRLIDEVRPELIVGDFRLSLAVSARQAGIPYISLTNWYWSPYAVRDFPIPQHPLVDLFGVPLAQRLFDLARPAVFAVHCLPLNRVRKRWGMASLGYDLTRVYTDADYTFYADLPDWASMRPLPDSHRFLGPVAWSPDIPLPAWWDALPTQTPVVYVNLGSSGPIGLLRTVLEAIASMPIALAVATAGRVDLGTDLPKNVYIADYLPGDAAARRAQTVICNGGSPSSQQALAAGVPVLGIPSNMDQHMNMRSIAATGAGISLRSDALEPAKLRASLDALLNAPAYRMASTRLQERIALYDAGHRFSAYVDAILHRSNLPPGQDGLAS